MAVTALKKINARVKHLARLHPGAKRVNLQRQAGAEYRSGKLGKVRNKKTAARKIHPKKKKVGAARNVGTDRLDKKRVNITVGSISTAHAKQIVKNNTKEQLAWALLQRDTARTKTAKRKISKKIIHLRTQLRGYES